MFLFYFIGKPITKLYIKLAMFSKDLQKVI